MKMARTTKRRAWTAGDVRELKKHSKNKTPVKTISRTMKRTPGAVSRKPGCWTYRLVIGVRIDLGAQFRISFEGPVLRLMAAIPSL